jgi:hypothetical protein
VVRVLRDADLPMVDDRLPSAPSDPAGLDALCRRWGLRTSVDRVLAALVA